MLIIAGSAAVVAGCSASREPLTTSSLELAASNLEAETSAESIPVAGVLTVDAAIERAVAYNLDLRVQEFEVLAESARTRVATAGLLPGVVADSSYYARSLGSATYSSMSPSIGQSSDLAVSWNVLDFGLSYVRFVQQRDRAQYKYEEYRRVAAQIANDTRVLYWRTIAAQKLERELGALSGEIGTAISQAEAAAKDTRLDPMQSLVSGRDILNDQRELNILRTTLAGSEAGLRQLINAPPTQSLSLSSDRQQDIRSHSQTSPSTSIKTALQNRAEIRQLIYEERIASDEIDAAVLQVLPGLNLNGGLASGTLSILGQSNWLAWGAKAAWNLISLVQLPSELEAIEVQRASLKKKMLAVAVAIAKQCYVSHELLRLQSLNYADARRFWLLQKKIHRQVQVSAKLGQSSKQALTRERVALLLAETRMMLAYSELEQARGTHLATLGEDASNLASMEQIVAKYELNKDAISLTDPRGSTASQGSAVAEASQ